MKFSWIVDIFMLGHTLKFGEICLRGCTVTPIITPSVGDPHLYPIHGSLDQPESYQKWHLGQVSHLSPADHILSLYFAMDQDMSPQNCPFPWGIQAFTFYMFLWPTRVHNTNGISISTVVFAGFTLVSSYIDCSRPHLMVCIAM